MHKPDDRRKVRRKIATVAAIGMCGMCLVVIFLWFRFFPPGPQIECHRLVDAAMQQWMLETTNTLWLPNVNGRSVESIALLVPYTGGNRDVLRDYRYVPGLKMDDPGELIWFYMAKPSRRTWHGDLYLPWHPMRWIVFSQRGLVQGEGELSEILTTQELKTRLGATISFVRENRRPDWQNVVSEHTAFLNSLED